MTNITMLCANRPRLLKQALDSIGDLSDATVTIRDAGMNPEVLQIARDWSADKPSRTLTSAAKIGTGPARNSVILTSDYLHERGDYLYLSDDDVYFLRPDWLRVLIDAYEVAWEYGFRVIGAYGHPFHHPIPGEQFVKTETGHVFPVYALALQSMLMKWEVWDKYGPFCDTPVGKVCQSEDADFCNKIREDGFKVGVISPPLLVNCGITNSFGDHIPGWEMVKGQAPEGVVVE